MTTTTWKELNQAVFSAWLLRRRERLSMAAVTTVPCGQCQGTGCVSRPADEVARAHPWHRHLFEQEICSKCGGSGKQPLDNRTVQEKTTA